MDLVHFILNNLDSLVPETTDHLQVVGIAMVISAASGLSLGVLAARRQRHDRRVRA